MENTGYHVCKPKSQEHRRGMKWFSSIARVVEHQVTEPPCTSTGPLKENEERVNLQHATQLYSVFVETGDERFLRLCEDFLSYVLGGPAPSSSAP